MSKALRTAFVSMSAAVLLTITASVAGGAEPLGIGSLSDGGAKPAAVARTYVDSGGVIHYAFDPAERPGATVAKVQGEPGQDGGCVFSGGGSGGPGADVTVVDELTLDPVSCIGTIAVATYAPEDVPDALNEALGPDYSTASSSATGTAPDSDGLTLAATTTWSAGLLAFIWDPLHLTTSSTQSNRTWGSDGSWSNSHSWNWLTASRWSRTSYGVTDTSTTVDTTGYYKNIIFCDPTAPTYANHYKTRIVTNSSGGWDWSYSMYKYGDCASLLSYHYSFAHS